MKTTNVWHYFETSTGDSSTVILDAAVRLRSIYGLDVDHASAQSSVGFLHPQNLVAGERDECYPAGRFAVNPILEFRSVLGLAGFSQWLPQCQQYLIPIHAFNRLL